MSVVVQKYGGTSVADAARIGNVARRIVATFEQGNSVCAVVSARGDTTDELIELAREITPNPPEREMDMLLSTGEQISVRADGHGHPAPRRTTAVSFTGAQIGIVTDSFHTKARIPNIHDRMRVQDAWTTARSSSSPASRASTRTTTSPRSAAAAPTPRPWRSPPRSMRPPARSTPTSTASTPPTRASCPKARKIDRISYDEMLELAASGAQVLHSGRSSSRSKYDVPIHVRSSFTDAEGTWVTDGGHGMHIEQQLEQPIIRAVSYTTDEAKVTLRGVPDKPGVAARVFTALADAHVNVDTIIQNTSESGHSDISCTIPVEDIPAADKALKEIVKELGAREYDTDAEIAKISLIGAGMRSHPGVAAKMFQTLADLGINLDMIGTSPIKISCVIGKEHVDEAVRALHTVFDLDEEPVSHEPADRGSC